MEDVVLEVRDVRVSRSRPYCENCAQEMWLIKIIPAGDGPELRTFECSKCAASQTMTIDSEAN
jgi:hypothetical protein